jgi:hypothetical protein
MIYCAKCGKGLPDDATFCDKCGQKVNEPVSPSERWERRWERRMDGRFNISDYRKDYLDGVGFGVFLIAIAVLILQYPWFWTEVTAWFSSWTHGPNMIPVILAEPVALFFTVMGGWGLVEGALRIISGRTMKGLMNVVSGLTGLAFAYMVRLYGQGALASSDILPFFIIIVGASIVLSAVLGSLAWSSRRD